MQKQLKLALTSLVALATMGSVGCSLEIEQTLAVDEGSALEVEAPAGSGNVGVASLEGGTVMAIDMFISYFDILFGDFEGDVSVVEILFASDGFSLLGIPTEELCVIPDPAGAGGGTFEANLFKKEATFDVAINTRAIVGSPIIGGLIPDGFAFPFNLQSTVPLSLTDMLGLLTGSGGLSVSQSFSETVDVDLGGASLPVGFSGTIALSSADAFPTSPLIDTCLELTAP